MTDTASAIKVIYILGYGHSGSTVLDIALGQHPEVQGTGELMQLTRLSREAWARGEYCSCGSKIPECPVWAAIVVRWRERSPAVDPLIRYPDLQVSCERLSAPLAARLSPVAGRRMREYGELTRGLFAAIREVTGASVIVDSSKSPGRALALSRVPGVDLRPIHLVRDGRGVAWSMRRALEQNYAAGVERSKRPRHVLRTGLSWAWVNLVSEAVWRRIGAGRILQLRYESFATDPAGALAEIGAATDVDFGAVAERIRGGSLLRPEHIVAGNRLRMAGPVRLQYDVEWQTKLSPAQRSAFEWLCRPLLRRYGYE